MQRSNISNAAGADVCVSLHRNSSSNPAANGFEVHVFTAPSPTAVALANNIYSRVVAAGVQSNRGIINSNFSVLRYTNAPAVLVELNFISNAIDNQLYDSNFYAYASAIASGIASTLGITCGGTPVLPPAPSPVGGDSVVRLIQTTLNNTYNAGLNVDGIWGPASRRALVRALQMELNHTYNANLVADGVFGVRTKAAIPAVRQGMRGNLVFILQAALHIAGYNVTPDGIFGPATQNAVRQFQQDARLTVDGVAGGNTFERLL
jgi:N-acetylmuramoyl-L-alanine amidase